ncbi:hypothetical protein GCM10011574_32900 [Microbispora bryophytorum]|uniref:Uncharacterized protein n=1 Tax=Microbispora bryophytorum TaxID=1460882 RepID=A0A8H9H4R7_9ACTN|nr:hypothetical protein GCM10011574_32900 [Microbispora bryophytorum]
MRHRPARRCAAPGSTADSATQPMSAAAPNTGPLRRVAGGAPFRGARSGVTTRQLKRHRPRKTRDRPEPEQFIPGFDRGSTEGMTYQGKANRP